MQSGPTRGALAGHGAVPLVWVLGMAAGMLIADALFSRMIPATAAIQWPVMVLGMLGGGWIARELGDLVRRRTARALAAR